MQLRQRRRTMMTGPGPSVCRHTPLPPKASPSHRTVTSAPGERAAAPSAPCAPLEGSVPFGDGGGGCRAVLFPFAGLDAAEVQGGGECL